MASPISLSASCIVTVYASCHLQSPTCSLRKCKHGSPLAIPLQEGQVDRIPIYVASTLRGFLQHHNCMMSSRRPMGMRCSVSPGANLQPVKPAPHADCPLQHSWQDSVHQGTSTQSSDNVLCAALDDLTGALERFPDNARLLTSAAVLHGRLGRVEHARELFRQGQAVDPRNAVLLRVRLKILFKAGREGK